MRKEQTLVYESIASLVLLIFFGWLQSADSKILKLPAQWLTIAVFMSVCLFPWNLEHNKIV